MPTISGQQNEYDFTSHDVELDITSTGIVLGKIDTKGFDHAAIYNEGLINNILMSGAGGKFVNQAGGQTRGVVLDNAHEGEIENYGIIHGGASVLGADSHIVNYGRISADTNFTNPAYMEIKGDGSTGDNYGRIDQVSVVGNDASFGTYIPS